MSESNHALRQQLLGAGRNVARQIEILEIPPIEQGAWAQDGRADLIESLAATLREIEEALRALD